MKITVELSAAEAAALKRFADKSSRHHALSVLYAHIPRDVREEQASQMLSAFAKVERALEDVRTYPWLETGRAE